MELPLSEATHLFLGKTVAKIDATSCNNVEFLFTDGTRVALHIECDGSGLPDVLACTHCVATFFTIFNFAEEKYAVMFRLRWGGEYHHCIKPPRVKRS